MPEKKIAMGTRFLRRWELKDFAFLEGMKTSIATMG
jgi:hypothetical protein